MGGQRVGLCKLSLFCISFEIAVFFTFPSQNGRSDWWRSVHFIQRWLQLTVRFCTTSTSCIFVTCFILWVTHFSILSNLLWKVPVVLSSWFNFFSLCSAMNPSRASMYPSSNPGVLVLSRWAFGCLIGCVFPSHDAACISTTQAQWSRTRKPKGSAQAFIPFMSLVDHTLSVSFVPWKYVTGTSQPIVERIYFIISNLFGTSRSLLREPE